MKKYLKKNKGLFLLPLGLIPFLILIFYVLGGGKGNEETQEQNNQATTGANYILPEAERSIEIFDKMEAYQSQGIGNDKTAISWQRDTTSGIINPNQDSSIVELASLADQNNGLPENLLAHIKQKEQEVRKELAEPEQKEEKKSAPEKRYNSYKPKPAKSNPKPIKETIEPSTGIEELDKVFDENIVLNRQNDSLKFYLEQTQNMLAEIEKKQNASFSLEKTTNKGFNRNNNTGGLIKAEIYETTTVFDGNRVKLRLLEDTRINGQKVPKNTFIYGICKVKNERLHIEIIQIPVGGNFLPVKLAIHDLDGLQGLYVPDNVARKVTQEVGASTNTSSMLGVTNNPLTYAGIRAAERTAQTLLKRIRLKKVTVKKNTLVYIINQKS
jgi:conjugative transposon TraM protein